MLLSLPCNFTELATPDIWQAAFNKRQAVLQDHESLGRTALQAACEIAHLKTLVEAQSSARGKLTAASLSSELVKLGLQQVVGGNKDDDGDSETGSLAPTFITWALSVHKHVVSNSRCVELLMDLEARFGSRSPFHRMSKLSVIATKPASVTSREWILASIHDAVCNGQLKAGDVTKTMLQGDRTHVGLVALCECKQRVTWRICVFQMFRKNFRDSLCLQFVPFSKVTACNHDFMVPENYTCQVLEYVHGDLFPKAGVRDMDRKLLKEATSSHAAYRDHSDENITWMARLNKSGIECFKLVEAKHGRSSCSLACYYFAT